MAVLGHHTAGLLIFQGKKKNFVGFSWQIRGKIGRFRGIFVGKKSKFEEKSADFAGFSREKVKIRGKIWPISWEKSQNSQKNRPISRHFSGKKSNFEGFSGANS